MGGANFLGIALVGILSIARLGKGNDRYYANLAAQDYYVSGGEPNGLWLQTAGAKALNLSGTVDKRDLRALFKGFLPDGTQLVQNACRKDRRPGNDLTFSVPKTLSLFWIATDPDTRHIIQQCQFEAVSKAICNLETDAAFARRGKEGHRLEPASIIAAAFEHGTSRALDPQLHTHVLVLNIAVRHDGSTGSLESQPLYQHKMLAGAIYRAHLAHLLQERLGLQITRTADSFEIVGVPKDLSDHFSKRRQDIQTRLGEKGLETAAAAATTAIETREDKKPVPPRSELFRQWMDTAVQFGFTTEHTHKMLNQVRPQNTRPQAERIVDLAIDAIAQASGSFDRTALQRQALYAAVEHGVAPTTIRNAIDHRLSHRTDIHKLPGPDQNARYTTSHVMSLEKDMAYSVERMTSSTIHRVSPRDVDAVVAHYSKPRDPVVEEFKYHVQQISRAAMRKDTRPIDRPRITRHAARTLNDQDITTIRRIATDPGRITTLRSAPGIDRDFVLACCRDLWQKNGCRVIGTSLAKASAARLQEETGIESMSLRRLELKMHPTLAFQVRHHLRQLLRAAQHKPTYSLDPLKVNKDTVLVVHGAQHVSREQMTSLLRTVAKQGGRIVFVEDDHKGARSHGPTPFDAICKHIAQPKAQEHRSVSPTRTPDDPTIQRPTIG